jgi:hypothetical protein
MKLREISQCDIDSIAYVIKMLPKENRGSILKEELSRFKLNSDFIDAFYEYLTPEIVSSSTGVTIEIVRKYPELFDLLTWVESPNKSVDLCLDDDFWAELSSENKETIFRTCPKKSVSNELFNARNSGVLSETRRNMFIKGDSSVQTEENLLKIIDSVNDEFIGQIKQSNLMTPAVIEQLGRSGSLSASTFFGILGLTDDVGFIKRILTNGELHFQENSNREFENNAYMKLLYKLPEDVMEELLRLIIEENLIVSKENLELTLELKEFTEEFLLEVINLFRYYGASGALGSYARMRDYDILLLQLSF